LASAGACLDSVLQAQKQAEHGKWAGYYSNHYVVAFPRAERYIGEFAKALEYGGVATRHRLVPVNAPANAQLDWIGGYGHGHPRLLPRVQVTSAKVSQQYKIEDPTQRPELIALEFDRV